MTNNTNNNPIIDKNGTKRWQLNNKLHREDGGPAVIWPSGSQYWYINGNKHRLDGPAVIYADGSQYWYINGNNITYEVNKWMKKNNITYPFSNESLVMFKFVFS